MQKSNEANMNITRDDVAAFFIDGRQDGGDCGFGL
jgi:hypothetical protein